MSQQKKQKDVRPERRIKFSEDLIWGVHPVLEALQAGPGRISELILQKDRHGTAWEELIDSARRAKIKCTFVERIKITGDEGRQVRHQGVVARGVAVNLTAFEDLLADFAASVAKGEKPRVIACDSIQDPHNLGAIIRSAHAAGVNRVLLTRERSAPLGGTAAKASAGAISLVDICQVTNLVNAIQALKDAGAWVFGAVKESSAQSIYETDFDLPACVIVGNEERGVRPLVQRHCDVLISIPMAGKLDSLNSSVAGAVIMFEMHRQSLNVSSLPSLP